MQKNHKESAIAPNIEGLPPPDPRLNRKHKLSAQATTALITVAPSLPESKKEGKVPLEKDIHRQALALYYALGPDRTLVKVAEHFKVKQSLVEQWSSRFNWKDRIAVLESRSKSDRFRDRIGDLLSLLLDSLIISNEETGAHELRSSAKTTAETIKLCVSAFKELRQDAREPEPGDNDPGKGPWKNGRMPGVMVNVNILGLGDKDT